LAKGLRNNWVIIVIFIALLVAIALLVPSFYQPANLINVARQSSIVGVVAIGMTFVILTGGIDLSVGSILALSSVTMAMLINEGMEYAFCLDYDTLFTRTHVEQMIECMAVAQESGDQVDALAPLQVRRGIKQLLGSVANGCMVSPNEDALVQLDTAHFGLTLIKLDALRDMPKPWFWGQPDKNNSWYNSPEGGKVDDDIYFWHGFKKAGKKLFLMPQVRVGHIEEMIAIVDKDGVAKHMYYHDWMREFEPNKTCAVVS
jgi:hypothetical protein